MPKHIKTHLRKELSDGFAPIHAERSVICRDPKTGEQRASRTLLVTDYCNGGSVYDYSKDLSATQKIEKSGEIIGQMAKIFLDIEASNCVFPDAKITNWLVDGGKVQLADDKSFLFTDASGRIDERKSSTKSILRTPGFVPPEWPKDGIQAGNTHAYILGVNLYHFSGLKNSSDVKDERSSRLYNLIIGLTQTDPDDRKTVSDARVELYSINNIGKYVGYLTGSRAFKGLPNDKRITFINQHEALKDDPIAQKTLTDGLISDNPELLEAHLTAEVQSYITAKGDKTFEDLMESSIMLDVPIQKQHDFIQYLEAHPDDEVRLMKELESFANFEQNLSEIREKYKFGDTDEHMEAYLNDIVSRLDAADSVADKLSIADELQTSLNTFKADPALNRVIEAVDDLRAKSSNFLSRGRNDKATRIEGALAQMSVPDRLKFTEKVKNKADSTHAVLEQLASHRNTWTKGYVYKTEDGQLDTKKAAKSFKDFKKQLEKISAAPEDAAPDDTVESRMAPR